MPSKVQTDTPFKMSTLAWALVISFVLGFFFCIYMGKQDAGCTQTPPVVQRSDKP